MFDRVIVAAVDAGAAVERKAEALGSGDSDAVREHDAAFTNSYHAFQAAAVSYRARFGSADRLASVAEQLAEPLAEVHNEKRRRSDDSAERERLTKLTDWITTELASAGGEQLEANKSGPVCSCVRRALRL